MYKKSWLNYLGEAVCVEFQKMQYIHLSEIEGLNGGSTCR